MLSKSCQVSFPEMMLPLSCSLESGQSREHMSKVNISYCAVLTTEGFHLF